jgi:predicted RNA-binding protein YlxR (DUF448 family)
MADPIRTCCACGKKNQKRNLKRFVWQNETVELDILQCMSGRGTYICANEKCHRTFHKQKKKWKRLFRL